MKKIFLGVFIVFLISLTSSTTYAAGILIKIDGVAVPSDVKPEVKNKRTMVPLRVISENLGATVDWINDKITLTKSDMKVIMSLNSTTAEKNGEKIVLDAKPYVKNNRVIVPFRFIAETFGCKVNYSSSTVTVDTEPLVINGVKVKTLQHEFHMTMGGVVSQYKGNAYNEAIYSIFAKKRGSTVDAPANYSWMPTIDILGSYYKEGQYNFLDTEGKSIKRFDIYTLIKTFPAEELKGYPEVLIHDATEDQWYLFSETAHQTILKLIDRANKNGFKQIISNTVV